MKFSVATHSVANVSSSIGHHQTNIQERKIIRTLLYCIVVGSRRLMHPDALQPKAYCTNFSL